MPTALRRLVAPCLAALALAGTARAQATPPTSDFLRDYTETRGFQLGRPTSPVPTPDGKAVLFLRAEPRQPVLSLYEFDTANGQTRALLTPDDLLRGAAEHLSPAEKARRERMRVTTRGFTAFALSPDGARLLVTLSGRLYLVARGGADKAHRVAELPTDNDPVLDPKLSPDGKWVGYVRGRDLYVMDLATKKERRLTRSSNERVTNGLAEFVAQEELDRFSGWWWSPDSRRIAFEEADSRGVETFTQSDPAHPEAPTLSVPYPRPGKANAKLRLGVIAATNSALPQPTWVSWDRDRFPYLATVRWERGGPLSLVVLSREQKDLQLLAADGQGRTKVLLAEHDDAWLNIDQTMPRWLPGGSAFLWSSESDRASGGYRRLELRDRDGSLRDIISPEHVEVLGLDHLDARHGTVWFRGVDQGVGQGDGSHPPESMPESMEEHVYFGGLAGHARRVDEQPGLCQSFFNDSPQAAPIYALSCASADAMPRTTVHDATDDSAAPRLLGELPSVAVEPSFTPRADYLRLGPDALAAVVVRPRDFDPHRRYPVLVDVYGGPHYNKVSRRLDQQLFRQWLADRGYLVVSVDGHGTPRRGRDWERSWKGPDGKSGGSFARALDDQVSALHLLAQRLPELDPSRVGITGWSFGGYLSALAVLRRPDVFHTAVAGAPVVDWHDYDTAYTERYLGLPDQNPDGYRQSSLLTYAKDLRRPLLLIHGTTDDNVYFLHALKLADALFRAGRPFDFLPLDGYTHLLPDATVRERLWTRILDTLGATLHPERVVLQGQAASAP